MLPLLQNGVFIDGVKRPKYHQIKHKSPKSRQKLLKLYLVGYICICANVTNNGDNLLFPLG